VRRRQDVECLTIFLELDLPLPSEVLQDKPGSLRLTNRLIIDIRNISDVAGFDTKKFHTAAKNILKYKGSKIANVRGSVNRRPTTIEAKSRFIERPNDARLASQGIVEGKFHWIDFS
jgi:hypothetical protein